MVCIKEYYVSIRFHSIGCYHLHDASWGFFLKIISDCKLLSSCPICTVSFVCTRLKCWILPFGIWMCSKLWKRTTESTHWYWCHFVTINCTKIMLPSKQEINFRTKICSRKLMFCRILIWVDKMVLFLIIKLIKLIYCPTFLICRMPICSNSLKRYLF